MAIHDCNAVAIATTWLSPRRANRDPITLLDVPCYLYKFKGRGVWGLTTIHNCSDALTAIAQSSIHWAKVRCTSVNKPHL